MAFSAQGTTFSFAGITATYTSISVEEPQAEVVDITSKDDPVGVRKMKSTGDFLTPARVRVDYIRAVSSPQPLTISGLSGALSISHSPSGVSVTKNAILESASTELAVGSIVRGSMQFVLDGT